MSQHVIVQFVTSEKRNTNFNSVAMTTSDFYTKLNNRKNYM